MGERFNRTLDPQDFLTVDSEGEESRPVVAAVKCYEHIYETLPSIDQLSLLDTSNGAVGNSTTTPPGNMSSKMSAGVAKQVTSKKPPVAMNFRKFNFGYFNTLVSSSNNNEAKATSHVGELESRKLANKSPNVSTNKTIEIFSNKETST